jgi:hypothetical protein
MDLSKQLKMLAQGINPVSGEVLDDKSVASYPEAIRLLFALSEEVASRPSKKSAPKLTDEQKHQANRHCQLISWNQS